MAIGHRPLSFLKDMNNPLRIGFVDYRPDVGHASNFLRRIRNRRETEGCDVIGVTTMEAKIGREWAETNALPYFENAEEFRGKVDGIMIPAATNPEHHWELFNYCADLGVPIFVDKPFAPDAETGAKIFALAKAKQVPIFSTSSLRFSDEILELQESTPLMVQAWGGWSEKFDEFIIHPVEAAMSLLGPDILAVRRDSAGSRHHIELIYAGGRRGDIYFWPGAQPYEVTACGESTWKHRSIASPIFERLLDRVFATFRSRQVPVTPRETLAVLKTIDACRISETGIETPVTWSEKELSL